MAPWGEPPPALARGARACIHACSTSFTLFPPHYLLLDELHERRKLLRGRVQHVDVLAQDGRHVAAAARSSRRATICRRRCVPEQRCHARQQGDELPEPHGVCEARLLAVEASRQRLEVWRRRERRLPRGARRRRLCEGTHHALPREDGVDLRERLQDPLAEEAPPAARLGVRADEAVEARYGGRAGGASPSTTGIRGAPSHGCGVPRRGQQVERTHRGRVEAHVHVKAADRDVVAPQGGGVGQEVRLGDEAGSGSEGKLGLRRSGRMVREGRVDPRRAASTHSVQAWNEPPGELLEVGEDVLVIKEAGRGLLDGSCTTV